MLRPETVIYFVDILEALPIGIIVLEKQQIIFLNSALRRHLGFPIKSSSEPGDSLSALVHPEDQPLLGSYSSELDSQLILRLRKIDGDYEPFEFSRLVTFDSKTIFMTKDVSGLQLDAAAELRLLNDSRRLLHQLFNHLEEAILLIRKGSIVACNEQAANRLGYQPGELQGKNLESLVSKIIGHPASSLFQKIQSQRSAEARLRTKEGQILQVRLIIEPLAESEEKIYLIKIAEDREIDSNQNLEKKMYELRSVYHGILSALNQIIDIKDPYNARHHQRVSDLARAIATIMDLPMETIEAVRVAGAIHDIGKLMIPAEIIAKPGSLSTNEFNLMKIHPEAGYEILKSIKFPWPVAEIVLQHHEHLDGSGYPYGLKGDEIRIEARIIAVADVMEAIISHRPYRPALSLQEAFFELESKKGLIYDPQAVEACLFLFKEIGYSFDSREWVSRLIAFKKSNSSPSFSPD